jgi:hypothetical protein
MAILRAVSLAVKPQRRDSQSGADRGRIAAMRALLFAAAVWLAWAGACAADPPDAVATFAANEAALAPHDDGVTLDDDPRAPALLRQRWTLAAEALARLLDAGPAPARADVDAALARLDKDLSGRLTRLDAASVLAVAWMGEQGDALILARTDGRYAVAWRADDDAARHADFPQLRAFDPANAAASCRASHAGAGWVECGPVFPKAGVLPNGDGGVRRFYLDASYAQAAGSTGEAQLSLWRWDGRTATPFSLIPYAFLLVSARALSVEGDVLTLPIKDAYASFSDCGSCVGRQRLWTLRLTPTGVRDLGKASAAPEVDVIDDLYDRALHHRPMAGLASPAVARLIAAQISKGDAAHGGPVMGQGSWQMTVNRRQVCLWTDYGGTALFTLAHARGAIRVIAARPLGDRFCGDAVHWSDALSG